jgi:16S rRNA (uracil1498-N3)-methyltransferase
MRCYIPPAQWKGKDIALGREESHHVAAVLRGRAGQTVRVFDGCGGEADAEIVSVSGHRVVVRPGERRVSPPPAVEIRLIQALPREQKMDWIVQKATELGAAVISPVFAEHSLVRLDAGRLAEKRARWEKIALNAAKQCGAVWLPRVDAPADLAAALRAEPRCDVLLAGLLRADARPLRDALRRSAGARGIGCVIGPEGDFTAAEQETILAAGAVPVTFGTLTLRAETAAIYALSVLQHELLDVRPA